MKRRLGSMLLTLAMVLTLVPAGVVPVRADDAPFGNVSGTGDNAKYTLTNQTYTLTGNVTLAGYIHVPSGVTATIDLNGYTIDRKLRSATINGCVIKVNGSLTLEDSSTNHGGKITGGSNSGEGGGVYVGNNGTLTMESGTICENKCSSNNGLGGGVYVANGGTFTMTGGTITGNTSTGDGGGVYVNGTFKLSGSANITGNRKGTKESAADYINNVYLPSGKKIAVSDNLTAAKISVRPVDKSTAFTSGLSGHGDASHFASDDMNYATKLVGGEAKLTAAYPVWVGGTQVTPENASDVLGDDKVSYTPADGDTPAALTLNGATISTAYDYIYPYGSYVYIRTAGIFTAEKLKINVTDDSTITGVDTTKNYNNSYGVYAQADLEIAVADGKTLTVAGGSTTGTGSKDSYGIYVNSGSLKGSFTFSGPGTLIASGGASATWWNYGIFASGAVTISGGTVNATGHTGGSTSGGVRAESQGVTITGGSLTAASDDTSGGPYKNYGINCGVNISGGSLTASGNDEAISGTVKNAIAGTGWTTADGTGTSALIAVSSAGQDISTYNYKKVQFPAVTRTLTITPPTNGSLAVTVNGSAVSSGGNVPVGAELTVTATPNSGYRLAALTVGDSDVTSAVSNNVYSFAMPNANTTVAATFAELAAVAAPTFTPAAGAVASGTAVTMTCATDGADIYYTTNGDTPSASSTKYTTPIPVTGAVTIKAIAIKDDMLDSAVASAAYTIAPPAAYTVTFDANGGTGTMAAQTVSGTAALSTNAFTRSGCTFNGWNTAADGSGTSYANTASITPTADLTLYAQWKPSSSGSNAPSGANGGYSPATTTTGATETVPVSGESGSVSVSVTVSGDTATVKAPTTAELNKVIGESVKTGDIVMDLRELNQGIATASIPAETVRAIEKAVSDPDNDAGSLTIKLTDGSVTFDDKALAAVAEQMKGSNLQLHLDGVGTSGLKAAQRSAIKAMDVQTVYDIYLTSNGVRVTDFKGGSATVTVTYTLKDGQRGGGVVVWYVADGGKMEEIPTRSNRDEVTFTVAHFSNYAVVYDAERAASSAQSGDCPGDAACPIGAFSDADPKAWYHDGVHWALENGVMNGMDDGLFAPNGTTTRAQVATMLYRLAGSPQVSGESAFTDVAEGMWYTDAICWAAAQGVVTGFERDGMTVFDPNAAVTREQLAAMLYRCAKLNGQGFAGAWMFPLDYPDAADVSEWADEAMHWMVRKGIINGMDGRLKPQGSATRAQTATIFMRYFTASAE